jgi:hypothetical protein
MRHPHLNQWLGVVVHTCHLSYMGKNKQEGCGPGRPWQKEKPYLKITKAKRADRVAQVVEHLPHWHKFNP